MLNMNLYLQAFECSMQNNHGSGARTAGSPVDTSCGLLWVWSSGAQAWSLSFALGFRHFFGEEGRALGLIGSDASADRWKA